MHKIEASIHKALLAHGLDLTPRNIKQCAYKMLLDPKLSPRMAAEAVAREKGRPISKAISKEWFELLARKYLNANN